MKGGLRIYILNIYIGYPSFWKGRFKIVHFESKQKSKGEFITRVTIIKEQLSTKENEVHGKWMTEDRMKKCGEFSPASIRSIKLYCEKFPESLTRYFGIVSFQKQIGEH